MRRGRLMAILLLACAILVVGLALTGVLELRSRSRVAVVLRGDVPPCWKLERHLGRTRIAAGEAWIEAEKAGRPAASPSL
jgi:hypothetical protein